MMQHFDEVWKQKARLQIELNELTLAQTEFFRNYIIVII
jgi:hypothetical protein